MECNTLYIWLALINFVLFKNSNNKSFLYLHSYKRSINDRLLSLFFSRENADRQVFFSEIPSLGHSGKLDGNQVLQTVINREMEIDGEFEDDSVVDITVVLNAKVYEVIRWIITLE